MLRETNRVVGTIGFMSYSDADSVVELGYSLARSCWNGGLMTEALAAVLRECFNVLRLHRVEAMHECDNPASGRVMENAVCATKGHCAARCSTRAISTTWSCGRCCGRTGTRAIERISSYIIWEDAPCTVDLLVSSGEIVIDMLKEMLVRQDA